MPGTYIPQCQADGSFEPKQCERATGYCWCVNENGGKIPGTHSPPGRAELKCSSKGDPFFYNLLGVTCLETWSIAFSLAYLCIYHLLVYTWTS